MAEDHGESSCSPKKSLLRALSLLQTTLENHKQLEKFCGLIQIVQVEFAVCTEHKCHRQSIMAVIWALSNASRPGPTAITMGKINSKFRKISADCQLSFQYKHDSKHESKSTKE